MKKFKQRPTGKQTALTKNENYKRQICIIKDIECSTEQAPVMVSEVSKSMTHGEDM